MKENETPIPYVKHWSVGGIYKKLDMLEAQKEKGKKKKSSVKVKNVGLRIGAAIRKIKAQPSPSAETEPGTGSKKSPHSRRGHWHHFCTGPRDGERKLILKWVAPTFINLKNKTQDTVVVYPVKTRKEEK